MVSDSESNLIPLGRLTPKCGRAGCERIALWRPVLLLRPPRPLVNGTASAELPLKVCDTCRMTTGVEDYVTDEGWQQICEGFHSVGRPPPERSRTTIEWRRA